MKESWGNKCKCNEINDREQQSEPEGLNHKGKYGASWPNAPSSATRRKGRNHCNRDAPAGFAAAPG
jgi:hypothetical protein